MLERKAEDEALQHRPENRTIWNTKTSLLLIRKRSLNCSRSCLYNSYCYWNLLPKLFSDPLRNEVVLLVLGKNDFLLLIMKDRNVEVDICEFTRCLYDGGIYHCTFRCTLQKRYFCFMNITPQNVNYKLYE